MFLGIEIGGTKLQLGIAAGDGSPLVDLLREEVDPARNAIGILEQIDRLSAVLLRKHKIERIGIGFGGPVDMATGHVLKSHQIDGWENIALASWCERTLGKPTIIGNDCDVAALAEAKFGAGQGSAIMLYVTVGTGIGGGLLVDKKLYGIQRPAAIEIGHLRPGLHCERPEETVESLASGWGIAAAAQERFTDDVIHWLDRIRSGENDVDRRLRLKFAKLEDQEYLADLWQRCGRDLQQLTAKQVAQAAADGNCIARNIMDQSLEALGWAIAQVLTITSAEVVVLGGGVSLIGEQMFFAPLRRQIERFIFPPLLNTYQIHAAALKELSVVHGALALAAMPVGTPAAGNP